MLADHQKRKELRGVCDNASKGKYVVMPRNDIQSKLTPSKVSNVRHPQLSMPMENSDFVIYLTSVTMFSTAFRVRASLTLSGNSTLILDPCTHAIILTVNLPSVSCWNREPEPGKWELDTCNHSFIFYSMWVIGIRMPLITVNTKFIAADVVTTAMSLKYECDNTTLNFNTGEYSDNYSVIFLACHYYPHYCNWSNKAFKVWCMPHRA